MITDRPRIPDATALAQALAAAATPRDARAVLTQWTASLTVESPAGAARPRGGPGGGGSLGIWRPTTIEGDTWFVRDETAPFKHFWADVDRIPPKRQAKRVVLLGESCARGFPLDPFFNCAAALHTFLRSAAGETLDIVDLAQCSMGPEGLAALLAASRVLQPDACVLFAGNNWLPGLEQLDFEAMAASLADSGSWRTVAAHCERAIRTTVADWMSALGRVRRELGVPVVLVIPAENRQDFPLPACLYNPLLDSREQARREALVADIDRACDDGRWADAEPLAAELVALEDGVSIVGLRALARCALARDAVDDAARLFADARDVLSYLPAQGLTSYRARTEEMRAGAVREGFPFVDVADELAALTGGRPPGRELFFDQCHMTVPGIRAAMAATAEQLLPLLDLPARSRHELSAVPIEVDPRAIAQAHFLAARLNMHRDELSRYHCERAIACSPAMAAVMRDYAELRVRLRPALFSDALQRLQDLEPRFPVIRFLDLIRPFNPKDVTLMSLMTRAIAAEDPGASTHCETVRAEERAVGETEGSLLPYAATGELRDVISVPRRAFEQFFRREVDFLVMRDASERPWRVRITARAGHPRSIDREAVLLVNGARVMAWELSATWRTIEWTVESHLLEAGENRLTIRWPDPGETRADRIRQACDAFASTNLLLERPAQAAFVPEIYTLYGEIHAFSACAVEALAASDGRPDLRQRVVV